MIEVILLEQIERLGAMGQVVRVRPGFARNFLLPQKKALRATKANQEVFEKQRAQLEAKNAALRSEAQTRAAKMDSLKLVIIRQASEMGHLYGSVSARDVAEAGVAAGHKIERAQVQIDVPVKTLGLFPVKVRLHPEVAVTVTVNVARSPEEAVVQAEKGVALLNKAAAAAEEASAVEVPASEAASAEEAPAGKKAKGTKKAAEPAAGEGAAEEGAKKARKPRAKKGDSAES